MKTGVFRNVYAIQIDGFSVYSNTCIKHNTLTFN